MYFYTKTADWRPPIPFWRVSIYILEGANLHFGGRNCLGGALYRKGGIPKKGGTLDFREKVSVPLSAWHARSAEMEVMYQAQRDGGAAPWWLCFLAAFR